MRRAPILVLVAAVVFAASCGGGSGGGGGDNCPTAEAALEASYTALGTIVDSAAVQPCLQLTQPTCPCPGGGQAVTNIAAQTVTLTSCKDSGGNNSFSGVFTLNTGQTAVSAQMTTFGSCSSGTATNISTQGCGGTISATCSGTAVNCTIVDDTAQPNGCALSCSCS